ncbi:MAG: type II toxin-antitoxin system YafQ family toxin [Oscillospiraceae bacterium]|nr:type II toxin-antitoxin system YafQ family toxin [Oscillospiraceae bacterium]
MIIETTIFKKDRKSLTKQGVDMGKLQKVITTLANGEALDKKYRDHKLNGNYIGYRECHVEPDWLLIYKIEKSKLILSLTRTGSHSELFNM